ncbi:hypothetical protein FIBSPDRAFT_888641 [Athelia psychrophila]|uniref:Uncharacterized protein n=1 Tax=Athelia psychrophila TaxID=1759441 RepID=A0A166ND86_9AGAM|nr:hypothetical protein FIBSPDRAFT_888641 [Fibularhizoctonia sp. CBS 109695]
MASNLGTDLQKGERYNSNEYDCWASIASSSIKVLLYAHTAVHHTSNLSVIVLNLSAIILITALACVAAIATITLPCPTTALVYDVPPYCLSRTLKGVHSDMEQSQWSRVISSQIW